MQLPMHACIMDTSQQYTCAVNKQAHLCGCNMSCLGVSLSVCQVHAYCPRFACATSTSEVVNEDALSAVHRSLTSFKILTAATAFRNSLLDHVPRGCRVVSHRDKAKSDHQQITWICHSRSTVKITAISSATASKHRPMPEPGPATLQSCIERYSATVGRLRATAAWIWPQAAAKPLDSCPISMTSKRQALQRLTGAPYVERARIAGWWRRTRVSSK